MSNRKTGTTFEKDFCTILSAHGYWAHNMAQNAAGQPFDIIAAKDGKVVPIDCKVCERDLFRLDRIEDNQRYAMTLWEKCGNRQGWFALKMSDEEIFMLPFRLLESLIDLGKKSLNYHDIVCNSIQLEIWLR